MRTCRLDRIPRENEPRPPYIGESRVGDPVPFESLSASNAGVVGRVKNRGWKGLPADGALEGSSPTRSAFRSAWYGDWRVRRFQLSLSRMLWNQSPSSSRWFTFRGQDACRRKIEGNTCGRHVGMRRRTRMYVRWLVLDAAKQKSAAKISHVLVDYT